MATTGDAGAGITTGVRSPPKRVTNMDQVIGSGGEPVSGSVESLTEELTQLARETAQLLLTPRYDEAKLAELAVRQREVRATIRAALAPENEGCEPVVVHAGLRVRGG